MIKSSHWLLDLILISLLTTISTSQIASAEAEFPQKNAWYRATPSVVWCGDNSSTTTLEVRIVGRTDVARVWMTDMGTNEDEGKLELFDDGTHGDQTAGDNLFTHSEVVIPCKIDRFFFHGWDNKWSFLRVELSDGTKMGNNYGLVIGLVDPKYKNSFEVTELAPGITATAYGLFLDDASHEVFSGYPIADVTCGKSNFVAYQKLYSVFNDDFDFAAVMPGLQIFRPNGFGENVPYNVLVKNDVQHIGIDIMDNTARFGSTERLKSVTYQSFSSIAIFDHEIAHTWGAAIGQSLGLLSPVYTYDVNQGHWNENADMQGQLGAYFFGDGGAIGHFAYRSENLWRLIRNTTTEPYSPLELYVMGLIPPEEVPPIHILTKPDLTEQTSITAGSSRTVTIEEIMAAEGGSRLPSHEDSQKDFTMAFIVAQDHPYDDAAYAFFSLISYQLTSKEGPSEYQQSLAPFYWATGGRATIETKLPLDLDIPLLPEQPIEENPEEASPVEDVEESSLKEETPTTPPEEEPALAAEEPTENPAHEKTPTCSLLPIGIILVLPLIFSHRRKQEN
jgi:hypothetical protein